jgi:hypothetical protein
MFGDVVEFERLDVSQRLRFHHPRDIRNRGAAACADYDFFAANDLSTAVCKSDRHCLGTDELRRTFDQLRAALLEFVEMHVDQPVHHLALMIARAGHVDPEFVFEDAELFAVTEVRHNLGAMNEILAGKTRNVGAGAANIFPLDHSDALPLLGQRPPDELGSFAAAEDDKIAMLDSREVFPGAHG